MLKPWILMWCPPAAFRWIWRWAWAGFRAAASWRSTAGKTTLSLHILAEAQKKGGTAAFVDAEHALDPQYAKRIGVNVNDLLISQPDSAEQGLQIVETLVRSGEVDIIVVDSVAALVPKSEVAGEMGELQIGVQARLMSQALRKLSGIVSKTKTIIIFIN